MNRSYFRTLTMVATVTAATTAQAGGINRTGQSTDLLFEKGNYLEFSIGRADPSVSGRDVGSLNPAQTPSGGVALALIRWPRA